MIATCGHNVDEGITCSISDMDGTSYVTLCVDCFINHYENGLIINKELKELVHRYEVKGYRMCMDTL